MKCKFCNDPRAEVISEEVDIGVGVQVEIVGYDCPACGPHTVCGTCGAWDFEPCPQWCQDVQAEQAGEL